MKILIFHPALAPYRVDFFNAIGREYDCKIVFMTHNNFNQNFNQKILLENAQYKYSYLDKHLKLFHRNVNFGYIKCIKEFSPDIIICSEFGLSLITTILYKLFSGKKFSLYTICDDSYEIFSKTNGIRKLSIQFASKLINGLISTNKEVSSLFIDKYKINKTYYFPIIRDDDSYRINLSKALCISNKYIDQFKLKGLKTFIYVGRLTAVKNINKLLEAYSKIKQELKDCSQLIIVGDGEDKESLIYQSKLLGLSKNVQFVGRYENYNLIAWYNIANFLILPSYSEPFGAVVSEALQAGCKVMISKYAGASCLVNNKNGVIFNSLDKTDFIKNLNLMLENAEVTLKAEVKPNLLPVTFKDKIKGLIKFLNEN